MAQAEWKDDAGILELPELAKERIGELREKAGPRGYTFMGRVVTDPTEDPRETIRRTPYGELEAGSKAATGATDLAAMMGLGKAAAATGVYVGRVGPGAAARGVVDTVKNIPTRWRNFWQNIGENITTQMPTYFRAGRGAPIEAREAKFQMEADIANRMEQAVTLGKNLTRNLTVGERLRADQMLRGSFNPVEETLLREARGRVKWTPDAKAYGRDVENAADELLAGKLKSGQASKQEQLYAAVRPARRAINEIQDELLSLGRLSPETVERFQENFGPYLARLYQSNNFTKKSLVFPVPKPVRAGTERLSPRGDRVEVEIPDLQAEMKQIQRMIGPEREFRREFRSRAGELAKRREVQEMTSEREEVLGETRKTETTSRTEEGSFGKVPLSGVAKRLEDVVENALVARGMSGPEAQAAIGRVKSAAVKAAQSGPDVEITGGIVRETTKETVERTTRQIREQVRSVIENLGINKGQQAALHAYYDIISRVGSRAKSIKVGDKSYRISPVMDIESASERVEALAPLLREGFHVEKRQGNKVTLFRDIPEEIRTAPAGKNVIVGGRPITEAQAQQVLQAHLASPTQAAPPVNQDWRGNWYWGGKVHHGMGEMRSDPGYTAGKSIGQAGREVAVTRYFKTISDNPEWASKDPVQGWTQMPKDNKRLADLSGKYVRPDIAAEINDSMRIKSDLEKAFNKINTLWKIGKVTNPATMMRNFYSSGILADWGGLSFYKPSGVRSYATAIAGFRGSDKKATALMAEAKQMGLFNAAYNAQELESLATSYLGSKEANPMLRMLDGIKGMVDKTGAGTLYGSIDNFFKASLFVHGRRELGFDPQQAARFAKKYGIDYSDISPFVRKVRELPLGAPFITFASKAIPLAIETAVKHPVRFWKYPVALLGLNELSQRSFGEDRDKVEKVGKLAELRTPRYLLLPGKTADGRQQYLDLGYILPFGDLLEAFDKLTGGAGDANISFEPLGGPAQPFLEIAMNKKLFGSKYQPNHVFEESDTLAQKAAKISDHLGKALLPAWAPPIPFTGFRGGYSTEAFRKALPKDGEIPGLIGESPMPMQDFFGRTRELGATIASKIFGIDVKNISMEDVYRAGLIHVTGLQDQLAKETGRIGRARISESQRQGELQILQDKYRALEREIRKTFGMDDRDVQKGRNARGGWTDDAGLFK